MRYKVGDIVWYLDKSAIPLDTIFATSDEAFAKVEEVQGW